MLFSQARWLILETARSEADRNGSQRQSNTLPRRQPLQSIRSVGRRANEPAPMSTVFGLVWKSAGSRLRPRGDGKRVDRDSA